MLAEQKPAQALGKTRAPERLPASPRFPQPQAGQRQQQQQRASPDVGVASLDAAVRVVAAVYSTWIFGDLV